MIEITIAPTTLVATLLIVPAVFFILGDIFGEPVKDVINNFLDHLREKIASQKIVGTKEHLLKLHGWATPRNLEHRPLYEWVDAVTGLDWQRSSELCRKHGWDPHQSAAIPLSK